MLRALIKNVPFGISILLLALAVGFIALIAPIGGNKALIVRSGSMQPAIGVGDLITVKPQPDYKAGEIVAFRDPAKASAIVTHRIVGQEVKNDKIFYQTKGDANDSADFSLVSKQNIIGRADYAISGIGRILAITKTKTGFLATVAFPALLVIFFEIHNIYKEVSFQSTSLRSSSSKTWTAGLKGVKKSKDHSVRAVYRQAAKHFYEHYGKPMGLPHPSASFRSLFSLLSLRGPKGRSNLLLRHSGNTERSEVVSRIDSGQARMTMGLFRTFLPILISFLLISNTFSFFSDTEISTGNIFTASESFGPPIAQTLVINEVLPDSSCSQGNTEAQWIEIYNGFSFSVNPKNFKITDGTNIVDLVTANNLSIAPGGFLLLAHNSAIWNDCYSDNGTQTGNLGGQLNIDVGELRLIDTDGTTVLDVARWDEPGDADPSQNQSIERVPTGLDSATGANFEPTDFIVREMPTPGYGSYLVLNEFLPNPQTTFLDEWVEIYNPSGSSVDLTGWTLKDIALSARSLTSLGSINSLGRVVYDDSGDGWLNNTTAETLQLKDPSGKIIDEHSYTGSSNDTSIGRETDAGNVWKTCTTPTKNASNNGSC